MGAFRYPGAKSKIAQQILQTFPALFRTGPLFGTSEKPLDYREPFFGAGGIGLKVIESLPRNSHVWINDADPGIANYWRCIVAHPQALRERVRDCQPTVARYRDCLARAEDPALDVVESAFITLFLHQCSYSGLGKKAGSPIGGWHQEGTKKTYDVACRWNAPKLMADIAHWHGVFRTHHVRVTCGDFEQVFTEIRHPSHTFFYCDPPYVKRGPELYSKSMSVADHERLAARIHALRNPWVLSYDDDAVVRRLYPDCNVQEITVRYIVAQGMADTREETAGHELLITPRPRVRWSLVVTGRTGHQYRALARTSGLPASTIRNRIRRGWTLEQALRHPRRSQGTQTCSGGHVHA